MEPVYKFLITMLLLLFFYFTSDNSVLNTQSGVEINKIKSELGLDTKTNASV